MGTRSIDLFDDPPWTAEGSDHSPVSFRPPLIAALTASVAFAVSMALPWYVSAETPYLSPFSHWLSLGWGPGNQIWAGVLLALALLIAVGLRMALRFPNMAYLAVLLALEVALVLLTLLELSAHSSINPGPPLHATWGAWIGATAAIVTCVGTAITMGVHRLVR